MSKCMTFVDETVDQKGTCTGLTAKDIVEFILEEVLLQAVIISDKGCNRIGDFNITEDFCQQFDQKVPSYIKDLEKKVEGHDSSSTKQELNLHSGENTNHSVSLLTAKENLDLILDAFARTEERVKNECKLISEELLANNEMQIQNGQIRLEINKSEEVSNNFVETARQDYFKKEDVIKDEKIEIEYFNEGKLNKIYVPLNDAPVKNKSEVFPPVREKCSKNEENVREADERRTENCASEKNLEKSGADSTKVAENPFPPFSSEELRQVWGNENSPMIGGWDGDMSSQPEEIIQLMEELSSVQVFPDVSADLTRPRACAFAEEDVKKMIKEIEEISFNQTHVNSEECDTAYHSDGQGDADLDSKSFTNKDTEKSTAASKDPEEVLSDSESRSVVAKSRNSLGKPAGYQKEQESSLTKIILKEEVKDENSTTPIINEKLSDSNESSMNFDKKENPENSETFTDEVCLDTPVLYTKEQNEFPTSSPVTEMNSDFSVKSDNNKDDMGSHLAGPFFSQNPNASKCSDRCKESLTEDNIENENSIQPEAEVKPDPSTASYTIAFEEKVPVDSEKEKTFFTNWIAPSISQPLKDKDQELSSASFSRSSFIKVEPSQNSQQTEKFLQELEFNYGTDSKFFSGKKSDNIKGSCSVNDTTQDFSSNSNLPNEKGSISLGTMKTDSCEVQFTSNFSVCKDRKSSPTDSRLPAEKFLRSSRTEIFTLSEKNLANEEVVQNDQNYLIYDEISEHVEHTLSFQKLKEEDWNSSNIRKLNGDSLTMSERGMTDKGSGIINSNDQKNKTERKEEKISDISQTQMEQSSTSSEKDLNKDNDKNSEFSTESAPSNLCKKFRLQSHKMFSGVDYDPVNHESNELILTDLEEAFIESTEDVIQIINPPESSTEEIPSKVSFSLFNESHIKESSTEGILKTSSNSSFSFTSNEENLLRENGNVQKKKIHSGMTTIGPIKNSDYDPKDLTIPDIDFGKMTRITSSRQLAKDVFGTELRTATSVRMIRENESDEESSLLIEGDRVELTSLVNRDIASLTKVQKVREVMSYYPKADEDFEDDDNLTRTRLDLKDVESMTDERYKVPDVSIPLLTFEMTNDTLEDDKEVIEKMHLVLSGNCFNNSTCYDDNCAEENKVKIEEMPSSCFINKHQILSQSPNTKCAPAESIKSMDDHLTAKNQGEPFTETEKTEEDQLQTTEFVPSDLPDSSDSIQRKYKTLGGALRKAQNKFFHKEEEMLLKSTKSLPRDAVKLMGTSSIKSMIDDCHSSASNVLKKSRSLLRNTQTIFKTLSQSRFIAHDSSKNLNKEKTSPSESDICNVEKKLSSLLRKEDFTKAKNLVKTKVEKNSKNFDSTSLARSESEMTHEKKDLKVALRDEENYKVDKMENFRKLLSKSPLVYKSQFVKSQVSVRNDVVEIEESSSPDFDELKAKKAKAEGRSLQSEINEKIANEQDKTKEQDKALVQSTPLITGTEAVLQESHKQAKFTHVREEGKLQVMKQAVEYEAMQPTFIVMETVPGLPTPDLESPSLHGVENDVGLVEKLSTEPFRDYKTADAIKIDSLGINAGVDAADEFSPRFSESEGKEPEETPKKSKNKKFAARFRSFWCSAFGKIKSSPKNAEQC